MRQILLALLFFAVHAPACAWNAAGHRLTAVIAWQQLSPAAQSAISEALSHHPDHHRWVEKSRSNHDVDVFAEASTWPDVIRNDPRFHDEEREPATPAFPGLSDTARHKRWHYVDLDAAGKTKSGELDTQIEHLSRLLRSTGEKAEISYALPWLAHLVGDIHQPLHVGRHGDEGGNQLEIENPFNKRLPNSNLHVYWDDLPGPPWLRGKRLAQNATRLLENHPAPKQGNVSLWREESHRLLNEAYPLASGSRRPVITEDFHRQSRETADRRIVEAGYRLGRLLDAIFGQRVPRETP
ncbi:MAG: S1/P1 nuclease [Dechloromonas sp.]|nr:S1/P1 nuclease [Dechloromonas sp.]